MNASTRALIPRNQASGKPIDTAAMTAKHRILPFATEVTVINHDNRRSAVVDRSPATALALGIDGSASVSQIVGVSKTHRKSDRAGQG